MADNPVLSTLATSRRQYLSQTELQQYTNITVTDAVEADDQISIAEEMIDDFVGAQEKFFGYEIFGKAQILAAGASTSGFILDPNYRYNYNFADYLKGMTIEIMGGTEAGKRRLITASTTDGILTCDSFDNPIDATSFYKIYQVGKFPRTQDTRLNSYETPIRYYKSVPEAIKRGVAAQVEYMINMGAAFFASDAVEKNMEKIGDYMYNKNKMNAHSTLIAPKARLLLKGYINRTGEIIVD